MTAAATKLATALGSIEDERFKPRSAPSPANGSTQSNSTPSEVFDDLFARIGAQLNRLADVIDTNVAAFNDLIHPSGSPAPAAASDHIPQNETKGTLCLPL